jgi:hypothetical protein
MTVVELAGAALAHVLAGRAAAVPEGGADAARPARPS